MNKYFLINDGTFSFYQNVVTGQIKWSLDRCDELVERGYDAEHTLRFFESRMEANNA